MHCGEITHLLKDLHLGKLVDILYVVSNSSSLTGRVVDVGVPVAVKRSADDAQRGACREKMIS